MTKQDTEFLNRYPRQPGSGHQLHPNLQLYCKAAELLSSVQNLRSRKVGAPYHVSLDPMSQPIFQCIYFEFYFLHALLSSDCRALQTKDQTYKCRLSTPV